MSTFANTFTAVGPGTATSLEKDQSFQYAVSGTFSASVVLEMSQDGGQAWVLVNTFTAAASGAIINKNTGRTLYRFRCATFVSGSAIVSIQDFPAVVAVKKLVIPAATGKVGSGTGWVPAGANDLSLATLPASQTASTLVVPVSGLKSGDRIKGFNLVGQVESAGGTVTIVAALRKSTAAAADVVDSVVGTVASVSFTIDAIVGISNTSITGLDDVVGPDETFYILITATTAASTDIALQSVVVSVEAA